MRDVVARFALDPDDTAEVRTEKETIFVVAFACSVAGLVWTAMYWAIFGWGRTAALPLAFTLFVGTALVVSHLRRDHRPAIHAQLLAIITITALIQWTIGGVFDAGFVMVWALLGPLGALMFFTPRRALKWLAFYVACVAVTVAFDDFFATRGQPVSDGVRRFFFAMNVGVGSLVIFGFAGFFVTEAIRQRRRANQLLLNVLPVQIAEELKQTNDTIARKHDEVSILFADIVGSTPLFAEMDPTAVVEWLNEVFTTLDDVVERHGLEKLRTMGDNYMVGAGVPEPRADHATALVACALEMLATIEALPDHDGRRIAFRVGINSGPVVAGVVGKSKFHYDLWGDAVNVASRMESSGEVGRIHVSDRTHELVQHAFACTPRGEIDVKGKGAMRTWFVDGPLPDGQP